MGQDAAAAAAIRTKKSLVMRVKMEPSLAPSTLRMPISLVRLDRAREITPKAPIQAMRTANTEA